MSAMSRKFREIEELYERWKAAGMEPGPLADEFYAKTDEWGEIIQRLRNGEVVEIGGEHVHFVKVK